jgi:hypothetical protein
VGSLIRCLNAKNIRLAEIHRQVVEVYVADAENKGNARKWCRLFKEGNTNVHEGNEVSALLWLWMVWKRKWIQMLGKQAIHNFWITRMFSKRVSISAPRNCYGMAEMFWGDLSLRRQTKAGLTIFQVTISIRRLNVDVAIKMFLEHSVNAFYTQPFFIFWTRYLIMNCNNEEFKMKMGLWTWEQSVCYRKIDLVHFWNKVWSFIKTLC